MELTRRALMGAAASLAPWAVGCRHEGHDLAVGYLNNLTHAQPLVGGARWAGALGVKMVAFPAGPAVMEALAAGSLIAGFMGPSALVNAYVRTQGKRGLVLRGSASGGASLVVRQAIGAPEALRGRKVTASQIGSTPDVSMRDFLPRHGLRPVDRGGDVMILPMPNAEAFALLKRGQLDGSWAQEPWASRMVAQAGLKRLLDERELWPQGRFPTSLLVTSRQALERHKGLLDRLVSLLDDETERLKKQADGGMAEVGAALARAVGKALPEPVLRDAWSRMELLNDPQEVALDEVKKRMETMGYLPPGGSLRGLVVGGSVTAGVER